MTRIRLLSPIGFPRQEDTEPVARLASLQGCTVTLVENGHQGVPPFMQRLRELFEEHGGLKSLEVRAKPSMSQPMPAELRAEVAASSDAVVTGVGT